MQYKRSEDYVNKEGQEKQCIKKRLHQNDVIRVFPKRVSAGY